MLIHANLGPVAYRGRGRVVGFIPRGRIYQSGRRPRASGDYAVTGTGRLTGRIMLGFNVGPRTKWHMADAVRAVRQIREAQGRTAGATFLSQRGVYQTKVGGKLVQEPGAQIVIQNVFDLAPRRAFVKDMQAVARALTKKLNQDSVLLEIQDAGKVIYSGVETNPRKMR